MSVWKYICHTGGNVHASCGCPFVNMPLCPHRSRQSTELRQPVLEFVSMKDLSDSDCDISQN